MNDDIVEWLRVDANWYRSDHPDSVVKLLVEEAADEIERLRAALKLTQSLDDPLLLEIERLRDQEERLCAEVERLRAALRLCVQAIEAQDGLKAEIARKDAALRRIASVDGVQAGADKDMYRRWRKVATDAIDDARAALAPAKTQP